MAYTVNHPFFAKTLFSRYLSDIHWWIAKIKYARIEIYKMVDGMSLYFVVNVKKGFWDKIAKMNCCEIKMIHCYVESEIYDL